MTRHPRHPIGRDDAADPMPPAYDHGGGVLSAGVHDGYRWLVGHNGMGVRCGYVAVPPGHPWHGRDTADLEAVEVHGGITYSAPAGGAWWVGFDCGHARDRPDGTLPLNEEGQFLVDADADLHRWLDRLEGGPRAEVRTTEFVEAECRSLCEQARRAAR